MNEEKSSSEEKEMNQSSSSSVNDMKDWDMLEPDILSNNDSPLNEKETEQIKSPSGLFIHDSFKHSGVEELVVDNDGSRHNESNSSSDIDIIDECHSDYAYTDDNHSDLSVPLMDISFCSSDISSAMSASQVISTSSPAAEGPTEVTETTPDPPPSHQGNTYFYYFMEIMRLVVQGLTEFYRDSISTKEACILGVVAVTCMCFATLQYLVVKTLDDKKMEQMESHVNKLMTENENLKNKVIAKIEGGKLFGDLDEGVRDLKSENYRLHKAMQAVIHQLEEQTNAIKKGIDVKGDSSKDAFRKEITKLKEQINLLRIDNEELQKQLVRIRYGKHPTHAENREESMSPGNEQDQKQEIQELRRKLDLEVAKLKNWKDSIEDFVKEIEKPSRSDGLTKKNREEHHHSEKRKEKYEEEKYKEKHGEEKYKETHDEEKRKFKKKGKRFYNWSWKEIKNNFKGTLESFPDVSDMISKYVLFDKKKVEGILDTICHYYKKAQDKTQRILESYSVDEKTESVKNDIWTLMGNMKNKWVHMKNDFLETHFAQSSDKQDGEEVSAESNENEQVDPEAKSSVDEQRSLPKDEPEDSGSDRVFDEKDWEESMWNVKEVDELLKEAQRRFTQQETNINSWMFERAQHRAELRENESPEIDEADNNWYLRKNKEEESSGKDSSKQYFMGN